jgi:hypothetical protein
MRYENIIVALGSDLCKKAFEFYNSNLLGISVSDLSHVPNLSLIEDVVLNTIVDLNRIKMYHPVNNPTRYKYAAYIGFWWERIQPFGCKVSDYKQLRALSQNLVAQNIPVSEAYPTVLDISKSINEIFVCDYILKMIQIHTDQPVERVSCYGKTVNYTDIKDSLEYFLRYRSYNAHDLELFLKGFNVCPIQD